MITSQTSNDGILVLAANLQMRQALERALSDQGYRNVAAGDLAESIELASDPTVQICVIELDEECVEFAVEAVRRLRLEASVARFILIADETGEDSQLPNSRTLGVRVLSRPFSMLEFIAAVDQAQH